MAILESSQDWGACTKSDSWVPPETEHMQIQHVNFKYTL